MIGPFDHPWLGGLFGDHEAAAIWSADRQLAHYLAFEAAYSRALGRAGVVDNTLAATAATLIEGYQPDIEQLRTGTERDGLPVPALIRALRAAAGPASVAIHTGATSQDVIDTALSLTLRETTSLLIARLRTLGAALDDLDSRFGKRRLTARTRMQAAVPITVADRIAIWRRPLETHVKRLEELRPRTEVLQLGGAAGNNGDLGGSAATVSDHVAASLGLAAPERTWHATRDGVAEYAGILSLITGTLGKMGQDICLMAQQGVEEVALSTGGGSSAMAHKRNPVQAELLVTLARFNAAQISGMHQALVHEQERSGSAWMLEWMILPQMALATARSLIVATNVSRGIIRMGDPK